MSKFYFKKGIYHFCEERYAGLRCSYKTVGEVIRCLDCGVEFPVFLTLGIKEIYRLKEWIAIGHIYPDLKLDKSFKELNI